MTISVGGSYALDPKTGELTLIERTLEAEEAAAPAAEPVPAEAPVDAPEPEAVTPTAPKRPGKNAPTE